VEESTSNDIASLMPCLAVKGINLMTSRGYGELMRLAIKWVKCFYSLQSLFTTGEHTVALRSEQSDRKPDAIGHLQKTDVSHQSTKGNPDASGFSFTIIRYTGTKTI